MMKDVNINPKYGLMSEEGYKTLRDDKIDTIYKAARRNRRIRLKRARDFKKLSPETQAFILGQRTERPCTDKT